MSTYLATNLSMSLLEVLEPVLVSVMWIQCLRTSRWVHFLFGSTINGCPSTQPYFWLWDRTGDVGAIGGLVLFIFYKDIFLTLFLSSSHMGRFTELRAVSISCLSERNIYKTTLATFPDFRHP